MSDILANIANHYYLYKTIHVVCIILWMGGMMVLSLLFSIHAKTSSNSSSYKTLLSIEKRIIQVTTPAMLLGSKLGFLNAYIYGFEALGMWFWVKMIVVLIIWSIYGFFLLSYKKFSTMTSFISSKYYDIIGFLILITILTAVSMVIIKPFD